MAAQSSAPTDGKTQSDGRKANAARPLDAAKDNAGPERYPAAGRDDGVESAGDPRAFANPRPRQRARDGG